MKKQLLIIPSIIFFLILFVFFYLLTIERDPSKIPSNLLNKNFPNFESESLLKENKFIALEEFKNEKILVNFFASWCKPCRDEHDYILQFSKVENLKVIGINYKDNSEKAISWLNKLGNPYSKIAIDKNGTIAINWGVYGIPETFIINSKGTVKYRHVGPVTKKIYKEINSLIKEIK